MRNTLLLLAALFLVFPVSMISAQSYLVGTADDFWVSTHSIPPITIPVNLTLAWDYSEEDQAKIESFRLYNSPDSGSYTYGTGNALAVTSAPSRLIGPIAMILPAGEPHYFVLTAYNSTTGEESDPSNEVTYIPQTDLPPQGEIIIQLQSIPSNGG